METLGQLLRAKLDNPNISPQGTSMDLRVAIPQNVSLTAVDVHVLNTCVQRTLMVAGVKYLRLQYGWGLAHAKAVYDAFRGEYPNG